MTGTEKDPLISTAPSLWTQREARGPCHESGRQADGEPGLWRRKPRGGRRERGEGVGLTRAQSRVPA